MSSRLKYSIKGFTVMDLLTGMVIMSIVIAMVYSLFSATTGQVGKYQGTRTEINDYLLMKAELSRSTESAELITAIPAGVEMVFNDREPIQFILKEEFLIRESGMISDTLYKHMQGFEVFADQTGNLERLQHMELSLSIGNKPIKAIIYKDYGLSASINQQLIHVD